MSNGKHTITKYLFKKILSYSFPKAVFGSYSDFHVNNLTVTHFKSISCKGKGQLFAVYNSSTKILIVQLKFLKVVTFGMTCINICMFLSIF